MREQEMKKTVIEYLQAGSVVYKKESIYTENKNIEVKVNKRLKRALGRVVYEFNMNSKKYEAISLELSEKTISSFSEKDVKRIIGHEICHIVTDSLYNGKATDHGIEFKEVANKMSKVLNIEIPNGAYSDIEMNKEMASKFKEEKFSSSRYAIFCPVCYMMTLRKGKADKKKIKEWINNYICSDKEHKGICLNVLDIKEKKLYSVNKNKVEVEAVDEETFNKIKEKYINN